MVPIVAVRLPSYNLFVQKKKKKQTELIESRASEAITHVKLLQNSLQTVDCKKASQLESISSKLNLVALSKQMKQWQNVPTQHLEKMSNNKALAAVKSTFTKMEKPLKKVSFCWCRSFVDLDFF